LEFSSSCLDGPCRETKARRKDVGSLHAARQSKEMAARQSKEMAKKIRTSAGVHAHHELVRLLEEDVARSQCMVSAFLSYMEEMVARNDRLVLPAGRIFMTDISVRDFIRRITTLSFASPSNYVVGLVYLHRLEKRQGGGMRRPLVTSETYQRLVLTATMLATKFQEDQQISDNDWAAIGGISTKELNALELNMLGGLDWNMYVSREEYESFASEVSEQTNNSSRFGGVDALAKCMYTDNALSAASTPWCSSSFDVPDKIKEGVVLPYGQEGQEHQDCWEGAPLLFQ